MSDTKCCPVFDPAPWDEETHTWTDRVFLKATIPQICHMPLPFSYNRTIGKLWKQAETCGIVPTEEKDYLMLSYEISPGKAELYLAVTGEHPDAQTEKISGNFMSKVFDGPYKDIPKFMLEMEDYTIAERKKVEKYYLYYAYCPKCARKFGHNFIVILAKLAES